MAEKNNESLFTRLSQLFRGGPIVRRKVRNYKGPSAQTALQAFGRGANDVYNSAISAYGTFDRMSRYSDFSEMEACIAGDTLIATPNGFVEIQELAKMYGPDETFIVYSYDHEKKQIVPALGKQARHTVTDHAYKITFDSGKTLVATPDHRVMLRDGTYREVQDLKQGDAMMPFYRRDLFATGDKENSEGYRWVYTMDYENSTCKNGWVPEHRLIASWVAGIALSDLGGKQHVHHKNFIKHDNSPENLQIMTEEEHLRYHAEILNGKKWDGETNGDWIERFKKEHSNFMKENNPAQRRDITFAKILQVCDRDGFNLYHLERVFDCDNRVIYRRLRDNGFNSFKSFARAYDPNWVNNGWNNKGTKNPRYDSSVTYQDVCNAYTVGDTIKSLAEKVGSTGTKVMNRIKAEGFSNFTHFKEDYHNHKIVSVEYHGVIDLYDLTVDGYKNYATDSIVVHNTPEIASALDIYSEECAPSDDKGTILHIHSDNRKVIELLENLFYDILNVEFNLPMWIRNLCKYGDFFMFVDVSPEYGVVNGYPIPIAEIEREEAYDANDPTAVRFRWITRGNAILENWQIAHFRLLGNDAFLPYGSSVLEAARRIWRQLILIEDAMLVYRIIRAPERRVFYIDVGAVAPEDVPTYMQAAQNQLKRNQIIDRNTGKVDMRYNPMSVDEDYFLPVRGDTSGTKIDTLAGGQNSSDIDDVKYIQSKLFSALKIPKAYLGYDEGVGAKATLAQEDIRFSRTIQRIQKTVISELNKIAIIHLYSHGFTDEDLLDFELSLTNPSTLAQQQKLELIKSQFEIAGAAPEAIVDISWIRKNVFGFSDAVSAEIERGREIDMQRASELENIGTRGVDDTGPADFGGGAEPAGAGGGEEPGGESVEDLFASDLPVGRVKSKGSSIRLLEDDDEEDDDDLEINIDIGRLSINDINAPIKAQNQIKRNVSGEKIKVSKKKHQPGEYGMPNWERMVGLGRTDDTLRDPYGDPGNPNKIFSHHDRGQPKVKSSPPQSPYDQFLDKKITQQAIMTKELNGTLKNMKTRLSISNGSSVLSESEEPDLDEELIITGEK